MRGPLASKVLNQLLLATDWGELDYLVVDMPPGTGDIQLTLSQTAALTGAVIVTTPHVLSLVDAAKGVELFRTVNIPTLSIVENMSFFKCEHNSVYYPFGKGGRKKLIQSLREQKTVTNIQEITEDIEKVPYFALPLCMEGAGMKLTKTTESEKNNNDNKKPLEEEDDQMELLSSPLVVSFPESESAKVYRSLSDAVINQIFQLQINAQYVRKEWILFYCHC
jgi:Mrp family chromosome partitioning ATPase